MVRTLDWPADEAMQVDGQVAELNELLSTNLDEQSLIPKIAAILKVMPTRSKIEFIMDGRLILSVSRHQNVYEYIHEPGIVLQIKGAELVNQMISGITHYLMTYIGNNRAVVYISNP